MHVFLCLVPAAVLRLRGIPVSSTRLRLHINTLTQVPPLLTLSPLHLTGEDVTTQFLRNSFTFFANVFRSEKRNKRELKVREKRRQAEEVTKDY